MSAKAEVLKKYPNARAHSWADCWVIYAGGCPNEAIGQGKTAAMAWRDASRPTVSNDGENVKG